MKAIFLLCFVLVVGVCADSTSDSEVPVPVPEPLPPAVGVKCSAFAALKIRVVGTGRCKGIAGADCTAIAAAQDAFREAYDSWWSEGGECEKVKLEEAAVAVANACASAYAKTIAKVTCEGQGGFACGWSISEGSAYAIAMARAIAQAAVDASGDTAQAFCVSDVEAVSGAVAEAAANAESKACVTGTGSAEDFQEAFVETIAQAVAEAFVTATAATCEETGAAAAKSLCTGEGGGKTKEQIKQEATAGAAAAGATASAEQCHESMMGCCASSYRKMTCTCTDEACAGTWQKIKEYRGETTRTWKMQGETTTCLCPLPTV